jgi:hypothetical protein
MKRSSRSKDVRSSSAATKLLLPINKHLLALYSLWPLSTCYCAWR